MMMHEVEAILAYATPTTHLYSSTTATTNYRIDTNTTCLLMKCLEIELHKGNSNTVITGMENSLDSADVIQFGRCVLSAVNEVCCLMMYKELTRLHRTTNTNMNESIPLTDTLADTLHKIPQRILESLPRVWREIIDHCLLHISNYHLMERAKCTSNTNHNHTNTVFCIPLLYYIHREDVALNLMYQEMSSDSITKTFSTSYNSLFWKKNSHTSGRLLDVNQEYNKYMFFKNQLKAPRDNLNSKLESTEILTNINNLVLNNSDVDGLHYVEQSSYEWRFTEDDRMHEVCRLIRSSRPQYLRLDKTPESNTATAANDIAAFRSRQQDRLLALCRRSLALPIGRGMVTLGTLTPMLAESIPIPPLPLIGRVPPNDSLVPLEATSSSPALTLWPEFHNGVASGLRLYSANNNTITKDTNGITRSWIQYMRASHLSPLMGTNNQVGAKNNTMAGVLLSLGLMKSLNVLSTRDILDLLSMVSI